MGWIKDKIDDEYRKHPNLDWSSLAETKILLELERKLELNDLNNIRV